MCHIRWALTLQLEYNEATVMANGKEIVLGMGGDNPEPVVLTADGLHARALLHVPHANGLILAVANDELLSRMENNTRNIVEMTTARVHFPGLGIVHTPQLDLAIISSRDKKGHTGVESNPIDSPIMALKHMLMGKTQGFASGGLFRWMRFMCVHTYPSIYTQM